MLIPDDLFPETIPPFFRDLKPEEVVALGRGDTPSPANVELHYTKHGWRTISPSELEDLFPGWQAWLDAREDEEYHELKMVLTAMAEWLPEMVAVRADTAVKMSRNQFPNIWKGLEDAIDTK